MPVDVMYYVYRRLNVLPSIWLLLNPFALVDLISLSLSHHEEPLGASYYLE